MAVDVLLIHQEASRIAPHLVAAGYAVTIVHDAKAACTSAGGLSHRFAVVGHVEDICRFELCGLLRAAAPSSRMFIIVAVAPTAYLTRIRCLEEGADIAIKEPVEAEELIYGIRMLIRTTTPPVSDSIMRYGSIELDLERHKASVYGKSIKLSALTLRLLQAFLMRPQQPLTRAELLKAIGYNPDQVELRTIDPHVKKLRTALTGAGAAGSIVAIHSTGYKLVNAQRKRGILQNDVMTLEASGD